MSIFVTGDTHGGEDIRCLNTSRFKQQYDLTKKDYVIICGDFGLVWNPMFDNEMKYWIDWLNKKNFTTLFVDGNHENFSRLLTYPVEYWHGGKITDSIYHLMRGQVFDIEGLLFFTMGGATSVDKQCRTEGINWWKQELPTKAEMEEGLLNLSKYNNKVDYILTHCCSKSLLSVVSNKLGYTLSHVDKLNKYLDNIDTKIDFKHWYFGHLHDDIQIDNKHTLLYNNVLQVV